MIIWPSVLKYFKIDEISCLVSVRPGRNEYRETCTVRMGCFGFSLVHMMHIPSQHRCLVESRDFHSISTVSELNLS